MFSNLLTPLKTPLKRSKVGFRVFSVIYSFVRSIFDILFSVFNYCKNGMGCSGPVRCSAHGLEQASSKCVFWGLRGVFTDGLCQIIPGFKAAPLDPAGLLDNITAPACSPLTITRIWRPTVLSVGRITWVFPFPFRQTHVVQLKSLFAGYLNEVIWLCWKCIRHSPSSQLRGGAGVSSKGLVIHQLGQLYETSTSVPSRALCGTLRVQRTDEH